MSEENRRVSTTPIPVPMPFGGLQPPVQPSSSTLGQTPAAVAPPPAPAAATAAGTEDATTTETTAAATTTEASTEPTPKDKDITMTDADAAASPARQSAASPAPTSGGAPAGRTGTPLRTTNGAQQQEPASNTSRAASAHPDPGFTMPAEAPPHGASVRQYLNTRVTGVLLEGMKLLAKDMPKDPLRVLGEFLLQRSKEIEGSTA
ncbi:uncharacterized protein JN550_010415 [Neoarthrinium moseri]|uniref:uncharacterized protein n=1 Tax=Neoarthrinium moseri TaxID=1658444 RepID=UPI001FDB7954|nr:uncharacterized protein JN550_010415 [Neoarthrinium moseri]KAI1862112.1 hypothetical protein JN550_010415 [Neoarthrinium moseri]